jgi:hypothetical protein
VVQGGEGGEGGWELSLTPRNCHSEDSLLDNVVGVLSISSNSVMRSNKPCRSPVSQRITGFPFYNGVLYGLFAGLLFCICVHDFLLFCGIQGSKKVLAFMSLAQKSQCFHP